MVRDSQAITIRSLVHQLAVDKSTHTALRGPEPRKVRLHRGSAKDQSVKWTMPRAFADRTSAHQTRRREPDSKNVSRARLVHVTSTFAFDFRRLTSEACRPPGTTTSRLMTDGRSSLQSPVPAFCILRPLWVLIISGFGPYRPDQDLDGYPPTYTIASGDPQGSMFPDNDMGWQPHPTRKRVSCRFSSSSVLFTPFHTHPLPSAFVSCPLACRAFALIPFAPYGVAVAHHLVAHRGVVCARSNLDQLPARCDSHSAHPPRATVRFLSPNARPLRYMARAPGRPRRIG
jgi:hypothetical protein